MTPSKDGSRLFGILNRAWRSTSTIFEHEPIGLWPVPDTKNLIVWHIGLCVDVVTPSRASLVDRVCVFTFSFLGLQGAVKAILIKQPGDPAYGRRKEKEIVQRSRLGL